MELLFLNIFGFATMQQPLNLHGRKNMKQKPDTSRQDLTEQDILAAMQAMEGYVDITPADFGEIYQRAYRHAMERVRLAVLAEQIMTRAVVSVRADTPLITVARRMAEHHITGVPVVDQEQRLLGIITETDFLRRMGATGHSSFMEVVARCLATKGCAALAIKDQPAEAIMSRPAIAVGPRTPAHEIAATMTARAINRLPVVDADNKPIGIISRADLIRASIPQEAPCPTSKK